MGDSAITFDVVIDAETKSYNEAKSSYRTKSNDEETKNFPTDFNEKNITYKTQNIYVLLTFLLITNELVIAVTIYCYLIKY